MRFAVNLPTSAGASEYSMLAFTDSIDWETQREYATLIEDLEFDGIGVPDHLMTGDGATTECLTTLAALARETEEVELYPKTVNDVLRHGPLLAKIAATLDNVSDGRLKLGMGAGWKTDEAVAFGYDWPSAPNRLRAMEETIEIAKRLWTKDEVSYEGDYYQVDGAVCKPHPTQDPHPPIMIGGGGEEFTLRIAAKQADEWNYWGDPSLYGKKLDVLREHCETYDTDYDDIDKSWFARCIIRETEPEVETILDEVPRFRDPDPDDPLSEYNNLIGTPEQVVETLSSYENTVDECVVEFVDLPDSTGPELFADEVIPQFT